MTRLQIRAVAFAHYWRMCAGLGDTDGQAFAYWSARPVVRRRWHKWSKGFPVASMVEPKVVDAVVEAVRADLLQRSQVGLLKYGVPLDQAGLGLRDWLQHAYEETLDTANYLKGAILRLDGETDATP